MKSVVFLGILLVAVFARVDCERKAFQNWDANHIKLAVEKLNTVDIPNDYDEFVDLLNPILIPRPPDSSGNVQVRNYIKSTLESYGWLVKTHEFTDKTPLGEKKFVNLIANFPFSKNFNPNKSNIEDRMIFACHHDSKFFTNITFVGATDSAVPCAILLDMAKYFYENFEKEDLKKMLQNVQFIFFDGEEAFVDWTDTDSLYGSRGYANKLLKTYGRKAFDSMQAFILLDLIGAYNCTFYNLFDNTTGNGYNMLMAIESKLIELELLSRNKTYFFNGIKRNWLFGDDHVPFLNQSVPALHMIAVPFPKQWHTENDNFENLNQSNIQDMRLIWKSFFLILMKDNLRF